MNCCAQVAVEKLDKRRVRYRGGRTTVEHAGHKRIASSRARHRLHYVPRERRVKIAEETDGSTIQAVAHQDVCRLGFACPLRRDCMPGLVESLKMPPFEPNI